MKAGKRFINSMKMVGFDYPQAIKAIQGKYGYTDVKDNSTDIWVYINDDYDIEIDMYAGKTEHRTYLRLWCRTNEKAEPHHYFGGDGRILAILATVGDINDIIANIDLLIDKVQANDYGVGKTKLYDNVRKY